MPILHRKAFTLIELLIVVAIIAILAAIAVPNFLEAQTRSKVSRAKADMRSIATALEAYRVDNNAYAVPSDEHGIQVPMASAVTDGFETRLSTLLTTPIAYIAHRPDEPFPASDRADEDPQYHYATRRHFVEQVDHASPDEFDDFVEQVLNKRGPIKYYILSHGPDRDHDELQGHPGDGNPKGDETGASLYDPTNGAVSSGDITYWGPGLGFAQ